MQPRMFICFIGEFVEPVAARNEYGRIESNATVAPFIQSNELRTAVSFSEEVSHSSIGRVGVSTAHSGSSMQHGKVMSY
jgi:hypothetical protein